MKYIGKVWFKKPMQMMADMLGLEDIVTYPGER